MKRRGRRDITKTKSLLKLFCFNSPYISKGKRKSKGYIGLDACSVLCTGITWCNKVA